jgi:hypothetical protein
MLPWKSGPSGPRKPRKKEGLSPAGVFWQARYYDLNVWSGRERIEKLGCIHRNPVKRGLCESPEDWEWTSFRHHLCEIEGAVEIESHWTARRREHLGVTVRLNPRA